MGKKPVVALIGLVWAGVALTGCENCKNCRKRFDPAPPVQQAKTDTIGAPITPGQTVSTPGAATGEGLRKETAVKTPEPTGSMGFGSTTPPAGGMTPPAATPVSNISNSLRSTEDPAPRLIGMPGRGDELGRPKEGPVSQVSPAEGEGTRMPPLPIRPALATSGMTSNTVQAGASLPSDSLSQPGQALPQINASAPSAPPAPLPSGVSAPPPVPVPPPAPVPSSSTLPPLPGS